MSKMLLDELPTNHRGIDWSKCIDLDVCGIYKDIEFKVTIIDYKNGILKFKYSNNEIFYMDTNSFKKCKFGKILKKHTREFKFEVEQYIKDDKRDLVITDREYRINKNNYDKKWYKYTCNKCGWAEGWIEENSLRFGGGCLCCANKKAILGINTIWDTNRWMCDLGVSEEDAKTHTCGSGEYIFITCPDCKKRKRIRISTIYNRKSISCNCGDGEFYPEKFMTSVLKQLELEFAKEYSPKWVGLEGRRYDFHIPKYNMIIETHGMQHYKESKGFKRSLQEEQENDRLKRELAFNNGIDKYIVVDCRESKFDWIVFNVYKQFKDYFDISKVDFGKAEEYALKNIVKEVCEYWNQKEEWETTQNLGLKFNLDRGTVTKYLKRGAILGWCDYNSKTEYDKGVSKLTKLKSKKIEIFKDNISLGMFESCSGLSRQSEELFGVKLNINGISRVCSGKAKQYKGYIFKYVEG